jgi:hypothetical protein
MKALATLAILFTISSGPASAATTVLDDRDGVGSLRAFVIAYLDRHRDTAFERDRTIKVAIAKTPLGPRDPQGYVIYIRSGGWCGSDGCHTLFVSHVAGRFEPLGFVCCTELPISIERPRGGNDAEFVVSVRSADHTGLAQVTLTRRGDAYDFHPPQLAAGTDGPVAPSNSHYGFLADLLLGFMGLG